MILDFAQECYYLKNKVGVVDFTKARRLVKFQNLWALQALGHLQNLLLPLYFWGNVSILKSYFWTCQKQFGTVQNNLDLSQNHLKVSKTIWFQNHFGLIEGQGPNVLGSGKVLLF